MNSLKLNEDKFYHQGYQYLLGIDEAGRGALCGPVVVAGVVFDRATVIEGLNDSKQITPKKRAQLFDQIVESAKSIYVEVVDIETIDKLNVYQATKAANLTICERLEDQYDFILTDAMPLHYDCSESCIKGDATYHSIAAASIIAKVVRDCIMEELALAYPLYQLDKHKGYCTKAHRHIIEQHGPISLIYRKTFEPVKSMLGMKLF